MDDESQLKESEDSFETKNELLQKEVYRLTEENRVLRIYVDKADRHFVNHYEYEVSAKESARIIDERNRCLNDQLTSIKMEMNDLKSVNSLLTKRLQMKEKDLIDLGKKTDGYIDKLKSEIKKAKLQNEQQKSEIKNMRLQNEILKSELENAKLLNEASHSEADKLMVLYRCSEKDKYIASMRSLDTEGNIRKLKKELHLLQNSIASQNETKRHNNESNEEEVQASLLADLGAGSEVTDIANFLSLLKYENSTNMNPLNESKRHETSATQSIKNDKSLLEKELTGLAGKVDKFCEEFEAKFGEKRSFLMTKLTSCDDQIQTLKKLFVELSQLKKRKNVLLDMMEEMDGIMSNYRKELECV